MKIKEGQTYKDLIYQELGTRIEAAKKELEELNKGTERIQNILKEQGEVKEGESEFGGTEITYSARAKEIFEPRIRKRKKIEETLRAERELLSLRTLGLETIAHKLDNLEAYKERENIYNEAVSKINDLSPTIVKLDNYRLEQATLSDPLLPNWASVCRQLETFRPRSIDEDSLKREFFEKLESAKVKFDKENQNRELYKLIDEKV